MANIFRFADRSLDLSQTHIMGVLNVTPDSFSDGGNFDSVDRAIEQAMLMVEQGASIIDVGGESTRPGAKSVSVNEEIDRVTPVLEALSKESIDALISVDTSTPEVMKMAIEFGAHLINDVRAFSKVGAIDAVADANVALCLMHMKGSPQTMQENPKYYSVVDDVKSYLSQRADLMLQSGVTADRIIFDPGFGFGKTLQHNLELLNGIAELRECGFPVLVGMSRKTMIGEILNKPVSERVIGSVAAAVLASVNGASIVRVHDVEETLDAIKVVNALKRL